MTTKDALEPQDTDSAMFKKTEQVVGRPPTTDHNINDEYMRDPPHNVDPSMGNNSNSEGSYKKLDQPARELGPGGFDASEGRRKQLDVETSMIDGGPRGE